MFWVIECYEQLEKLQLKEYRSAFIEIIPYNDLLHPSLNNISLIYLKPIESKKAYILCLDHSESLSLNFSDVENFLKTYENLYVRNKKQFLHYFQLNSSIDILYNCPNLEQITNNVYQHFYNLYPNNLEINKIIPITKHYEKFELIYKNIKPYFPSERNKFNDKADIVFFYIENNGFNIEQPLFTEYYGNINQMFNIRFKTCYTQYNLHTLTRRPSNSFNGINFAALNKEDGVRKCFIPSNNKFIEIDFSAYHPFLVSQLVNYNFEKPIYETFSKYSGLSLEESKKEVFRNLYGNINKKYKDWEFFKKTQIYINELWNKFNSEGFIKDEISGHIFDKEKLENMNPNKLFNYVLQLKETTNNVLIMWDIIKILRGKNTKIVLYCYDSMLFDFDKNEQETMEKIYEYLRENNLNFKIKIGENYNF